METKWMRFLEMSAHALALVSVWRGASAVIAHNTVAEPLGLLQTLEPLAIPTMVLAVMVSVAALQIRLRGRQNMRRAIHDEQTRIEAAPPVAETRSITDHREQLIADLRHQVVELLQEKERLNGLLQEKSICLRTDTLTGVFNRLAYEEQLEQEFHRWQRFGHPLTFVIWDIDHFKQINDRYGHDIGDQVLRNVACQLAARLRSTDFVARYGGEEFAMLLPGAKAAEALEVVDQIRLAIADCGFDNGQIRIPVTLSCGIASFEPEDCPRSVFKRADHALYRAKNSGRNCCWVA